jgi:hypothetical protein
MDNQTSHRGLSSRVGTSNVKNGLPAKGVRVSAAGYYRLRRVPREVTLGNSG